jgi:ribosomal protein S18 acetylase RimI-like enzyme
MDVQQNRVEIKIAKYDQLNEIFDIYYQCKLDMENRNIYQWTDEYPNIEIISNDIRQNQLYCISQNENCIGAINISSIQEPEYENVLWSDNSMSFIVIHRLAIHPNFQRNGFAKKLMDFAENFALNKKISSIRLDAYSGNESVLRFYENRNYVKKGEVNFTGRKLSFYCYEKILNAYH